MKINKAWFAAMAVLVFATCESFPVFPSQPASGSDTQPAVSGTVGTGQVVSVTVRDASGKTIPGFSVTFTIDAGGGSLSAAPGGTAAVVDLSSPGGPDFQTGSSTLTTTTNSSGVASATWTLGGGAGTQTMHATAGAHTFNFSATASAQVNPTQLAIVDGNNQQVSVLQPVPTKPKVQLKDAFGNIVAKAGVSVTFATGIEPANTATHAAVTGGTVQTGSDGTATVGNWTLGNQAGQYTLVASSAGLTSTTFAANATASLIPRLTVSAGDNQTGTVATALGSPISVQLLDQNNNQIPNITVTFSVASGGGSITGATATTNSSGIATLGSWTLGTGAGSGNNTLSANASVNGTAATPVTITASAQAGAATSIALNGGNNQTGTVGSRLATDPSVITKDQFGNNKSGVAVTFTIGSGGGSVTSGTVSTNASGVAATGWSLGSSPGTNTMSATAVGLTGSPVAFTATGQLSGSGSVTINAGNNQTATVNTNVAVAPSILIKDALNNPVPNVSVTFTPAGGSGSVTGGTTTTNSSGIATVGSWKLGTAAGAQTLNVSAGSSGNTSFSATATADVPASIAANSAVSQSAQVGTTVAAPPSAIVRDQFNNPVANNSVTFTLTAAATGGQINGGAGPVVVSTNSSGIATLTSWKVGNVTGNNNNTVTAATAPAVSGSPVTFNASGTPAPAGMSKNGGDNQSATVNTNVATPPSVLINDGLGNPIVGATVTFAVASGGGSITGSATAQTQANGIATFAGSWKLGTLAGANTMTASSPAAASGSPQTFTATGTADNPSQMSISAGNGQTANAGSAVATPPAVLVRDQFSNPVSGVSITFAVATGGGNVTGGGATTNASGIATVGSWTLGNTAGANSLTASSSAPSLSGVTVTFNATGAVGPAAIITANSAQSQSATVNTAVGTAPSVKVTDAVGNAKSGVSVTFAVTAGGGSGTGLTPTTDVNGIATVGSWTLGQTAGSNTMTASSGSLTGSPVSFSATGTAGAATQIAANSAVNQSAVAGAQVGAPPSVIVKDAFNNPKSGVSVTFAVTGGGGSGTGLSPTTDASGVATAGSWTLGTVAGTNNNTMTASSGSLTGSPVTFTASGNVGPGVVSVTAGTGQSATVNQNVAGGITVNVKDANGNIVATNTTVTFAVSGGGGSVTGGSVGTDASGNATLAGGSWKLGTTAGTNTLTISVSGGTSAQVTATGTADAAASIAISGGNGQSATVNTNVATAPSVIVKDQFNNPVSGVSVTFAVATGGGSGTGLSPTTNASGIATVGSWQLGTTAGSNTMTASSGALTGSPVTFTATGTAGAAAAIALTSGDAQTATHGTAVAAAITVTVTDAFGNLVNGASVSFAVTAGGGSVTNATQSTNASGVATLPGGSWTLGAAATTQTLTATVNGQTVAISATSN